MTEQVVTIEGSSTPCAELPRGQQRTVLYTDRIKRLVAKGYFVIKSGPTDVVQAKPGKVESPEPQPTNVEPSVDPATQPVSDAGPHYSNPFAAPVVPQHPNETAQHEPAAEEPVQTDEKPTG